MANGNLLPGGGGVTAGHGLSSNEEALIGRIKYPLIRGAVSKLWQAKVQLQFTGWLQYVPPALVALLLLVAGWIAELFGGGWLALLLNGCAALLLAVTLFDLITVKFRLRPPERLPARNDGLDVFDLMQARRSCRSYQIRTLSAADRSELLASVARHSSDATVGTAPIRFEYVAAPLTVWPVVNAREFLVAVAPKEYNRLAVIDVGRCLQKIVIDATRMGLGTCWIGPGADRTSISRHLGERFDSEQDHVICVCAVGYASCYVPLFLRIFNARMHTRLPLSALFFADPQLKKPLNLEIPFLQRFGRTFESCQWAPSSYNGQTTRCVGILADDGAGGSARLARLDFYAVTASRYYAAVAVGIWCANWEMGCEALGIPGHLAVLPATPPGIGEDHALPASPRYDISWIPDDARGDVANR